MSERPISAVIERWRERAALALYRVATTLDPKPRVEIDRRDGEPDRPMPERERLRGCLTLWATFAPRELLETVPGSNGKTLAQLTAEALDDAQRSITGGYDDR
jgi:hypothetical protein